MQMKYYAANRVCNVADLTMYRNYVVEVEAATHSVTRLFALEGEMRHTEWRGGLILLCEELPIRTTGETFADFLSRMHAKIQHQQSASLRAYHVTSFNVNLMEFTTDSRIVIL